MPRSQGVEALLMSEDPPPFGNGVDHIPHRPVSEGEEVDNSTPHEDAIEAILGLLLEMSQLVEMCCDAFAAANVVVSTRGKEGLRGERC